MICPKCNGEGQKIDDLAQKPYYKCRDCGWTFTENESFSIVQDEVGEPDDE